MEQKYTNKKVCNTISIPSLLYYFYYVEKGDYTYDEKSKRNNW